MAEAEIETKLCNNCKKQINANNFMMHEMHCRRHIALCEHCKEPVPKDEMESHFEETHAKTPCPKCQVQVEKSHLEDHQENDCAKKPMKCVYCHLDFPKVDFEAHADYCGSRTEACPKCGQYIKLKDQVKHEDSNCRFPETKPVNTNTRPSVNLPSANEYLAGLPGINPFQLDEMQRVLGTQGMAPSYQPPVETRNKNKPAAAGLQNRRNVARVTKTVNVKPTVNKNSGTAGKNKLDSRGELDRLLALQIAEDDEGRGKLDRLLALQIAEDDDGGGNDVEGIAMMRELETDSQYPLYNGHHTDNTFSNSLVMIPCEFCGSQFAADDLVQHQSGCSLDRISAMLPQLSPNSGSSSNISNNSRVDAGEQNRMRSPIQEPFGLINNFPVYGADQWLDDTVVATADPDDDSLCLPCEFCCELFPVDSLVQHQAICDSNTTMTPRNLSSHSRAGDSGRTRQKTKPAVNNSSARLLEHNFPNLSSRRHQAPPSFDIDLDDEEGEGMRRRGPTSKGATHTVRKPSTNTSTSSGANGVSQRTTQGNARVTHKKYGVQAPDRGDHYTRPSVFSRPLGESDERDTESWLQSQKQSRTGSDQRTQSNFDQLMRDPSQSSQHDLLGHIGQSIPRTTAPVKSVNVKANSRPKASVTNTSRSSVSTTSRSPALGIASVPRAANNTALPGGTANPLRNRTNKPNFEVRVRPAEADQLSDAVSSQRGVRRTRVFDAGSTRQRSDKR